MKITLLILSFIMSAIFGSVFILLNLWLLKLNVLYAFSNNVVNNLIIWVWMEIMVLVKLGMFVEYHEIKKVHYKLESIVINKSDQFPSVI